MYWAAGCLINDIIVSHVMYLIISCGVHSRTAFVLLIALEGVAFIRGRLSFEGGVHSRVAFNWISMVCGSVLPGNCLAVISAFGHLLLVVCVCARARKRECVCLRTRKRECALVLAQVQHFCDVPTSWQDSRMHGWTDAIVLLSGISRMDSSGFSAGFANVELRRMMHWLVCIQNISLSFVKNGNVSFFVVFVERLWCFLSHCVFSLPCTCLSQSLPVAPWPVHFFSLYRSTVLFLASVVTPSLCSTTLPPLPFSCGLEVIWCRREYGVSDRMPSYSSVCSHAQFRSCLCMLPLVLK